MAEAPRDQNHVTAALFESSTSPGTTISGKIIELTGRIKVDANTSGGTVSEVDTGTGLTGGPITTTGTISLNSKLAPMDTLTGNSLKVLRVNVGETAVEYATVSTGLTVGTTTITSGTNTRILYNNSGVLGEYTLTGTGTVVAMQTSPSLLTSLLMDSGFVMNWASSNVVLTHSSGILTLGTGELRITTVGTNSASVPTLGSTSTLTNKTLTSPTITTANLSGAQQLAEGAGLRLDASLSADGTYSGTTISGTAGTTLAFGDLIYLAAADSRWELVDADSSTTCGAVLTGFCVLAAAADGDPTVILLDGNIRADAAFPSLTVGAPVYASTTAGDVQVAQPSGTDDVIHVVGFALTADSLLVKISPDYITHT